MDNTPSGIKIVDKLALVLSRTGLVISLAVLFVMLFGTVYDVGSRFFLNKPIVGVIEFAGAYLPAFTFLGLAMTQRLKGNINVTFGLQKLAPRRRKVAEFFAILLSLLFAGVLAWQTSSGALFSFDLREYHWGVVGLGLTIWIWPAKVAVAVGLWMLCLEYVVELLRMLAQLTGRLPIEAVMEEAKSHV